MLNQKVFLGVSGIHWFHQCSLQAALENQKNEQSLAPKKKASFLLRFKKSIYFWWDSLVSPMFPSSYA